MDPIVLRDQLRKLHEELSAAPTLDPESAHLLSEIVKDVERLLRLPAAPGVRDARASLPERLEKIAVLFEVDHPTLAASSRRLVDLLGKAGL